MRPRIKYFLQSTQMNNSDLMEMPGSILLTPETQTSHWDESSPNVSKQTNKRKWFRQFIRYKLLLLLIYCNMLEFQIDARF